MMARARTLPRLGVLGWVSVGILTFWTFIVLFGPWIAPHPESAIVSDNSFAPAFSEEGLLLGSDYLGRDLLSRLLYGARVTLGLAFLATIIAFVFGVTLGFASGVYGGRLDDVMARVNDAFISFPSIILALILVSAFGSSLFFLLVAVAFIEATRVFRLSRSLAQNIVVQDFVQVSRARGESNWWIIANDILPNAVSPLLTDFGLRFTFSILLLSALSFLGLGIQPPFSDWGSMVKENQAALNYIIFFGPVVALAPLLPALCIFSVTFANNTLVDLNQARSQHDISEELVK